MCEPSRLHWRASPALRGSARSGVQVRGGKLGLSITLWRKAMDDRITLAHGAGGEKYRELVESVFLPAYGSDELCKMGDSAVCTLGAPSLSACAPAPFSSLLPRLAFTTDSFVVNPLFFPGGDIGSLCVSGTVNDLAMSGATPAYISVAMILEAGLDMGVLRRVCASVAATAKAAGVKVVTGDTKVVERGKADKMYITTAGVGAVTGEWELPGQRAAAGDVIICSGTIANHGMAVMAAREGLELGSILSDARPLGSLAAAALKTGARINAMRDPTRGGVGATVCEWSAEKNGYGHLISRAQRDSFPSRGSLGVEDASGVEEVERLRAGTSSPPHAAELPSQHRHRSALALRERFAFSWGSLGGEDASGVEEVCEWGAEKNGYGHLISRAQRDSFPSWGSSTVEEVCGAAVNITLDEGALPLRGDTRAACALLGIDPLFVANEGIFLLSVPEKDAKAVLTALRAHPDGRDAAIVGRVTAGEGHVFIQKEIGTKRLVIMPRGELLPRIC